MKYFLDVVINEIKSIFSSKSYIFLICLWPFIDCLFLGGIYFYGNVQSMPIAVIDNDNSKISRTITRYFNTSYAFDVVYRINSFDELKDLIIKNKISMGVYIPKGTQQNIKKFLPTNVGFYIDGTNYLTANLSEIESATIIGTINAGIRTTMMKKKGIPSRQANDMIVPIKNDTSKMFNPTYHYGYFLTPGLWISILGQLLLIFGALTIGKYLEFNKTKKIENIFLFVLAKLFVYTIISLIYFEILFRIFFRLFEIPFDGNTFGAITLSSLFIIATILLGMLLAAVTGCRVDALKGCLLVGAPAFLLSGYTWPLDQMPKIMSKIATFIPLTSYLEGFRKIFQQNMTIEYIFPFANMIIFLIVLYFVMTCFCLKIRSDRKFKNKIINKINWQNKK